jgi:hypothetical protein
LTAISTKQAQALVKQGFFHMLANLPADQHPVELLAKPAREYGTEIVGSPLAIHLGLT